MKEGSSQPPSAIDRFEDFLKRSERSPLTIKNYLSDLRAFGRWFQEANGDEPEPDRITPTDLREFKQSLINRELRPRTINRKLATLRSFLSWAASTGDLRDGRTPNMPRGLPEGKLGPRWLDRRERNALVRTVERGGKSRDIAIIKVFLNTGLRVMELCSLLWQDVTISARKGTLTVRKGKGRKRRQIPLNLDARKALLELGYQEHAGNPLFIFTGQRGRLTPRGVQTMLRKYADPADLPEVSPQNMRHTFCKSLIDAGASLQEVASLAGHESLETTRRYCEPSLKDLERTVKLVEEENS